MRTDEEGAVCRPASREKKNCSLSKEQNWELAFASPRMRMWRVHDECIHIGNLSLRDALARPTLYMMRCGFLQTNTISHRHRPPTARHAPFLPSLTCLATTAPTTSVPTQTSTASLASPQARLHPVVHRRDGAYSASGHAIPI